MNSLFELSREVARLNNEKKFEEALNCFKANKSKFSSEQIGANTFIVSEMLKSLRKTGDFKSAFRFLSIYNIKIDSDTTEKVLTAYGWLLHSKFKAENNSNHSAHEFNEDIVDDENVANDVNFDLNKSEIIEKIETCIQLLQSFNSDYAYTLLSNLFNVVVKTEKRKASTNWLTINNFCDLINPELLSTQCETIEVDRKGVKKLMELASDKENWYAYKTKALIKLGLYNECFELSMLAINTFDKFHYSNDVWFARRVALSKKALGNVDEAIEELLQVSKRKSDWFILKELAELYKEVGNGEKAFKYAIQSVNGFGELEYKVDLIFLLGELLYLKEKYDLAFKHYSLSKLLRISEKWNIPNKLQEALSQFEHKEIGLESLNGLKKELYEYWNSFNAQKNVSFHQNRKMLYEGEISRILHNDEKGADGFIKDKSSNSYYFRVNSADKIRHEIRTGLRVNFNVLPATDTKKARATNLKPINR